MEVGQEVVGVLEADRDAHEAGADAGRASSSGLRPTWVELAGCVTRVSGPPSDEAIWASRTPSTNRRPASRPPAQIDRRSPNRP